MADLSHLSDEELDAAIKAQAPSDLTHMSDADLDKAIQAAQPAAQPEAWGHWAIRQGLPLVGQIGGGLAAGAAATPETAGLGTIPAAMGGAAAGNVAGHEAAGWLNHKIYGDEAPTYNSMNDLKRVGGEAAVGATAELGGQILGKGIGAVANSAVIKPYLDEAGNLVVNGMNKVGQYVGGKAENLAVRATGATGVQASKFAPGTGRMLLDDGIVKFGRSQSGIADAASDALDAQGDIIKSTIKTLAEQGATGSKEDLAAGIQAKIDELAGQTSQKNVVRQLEGIKEDVMAGPDKPDINLLQADKKGFQGRVNWANPEGNDALAAASDVYKNAVIDTGAATDFKAAKALADANAKTHDLIPIAQASAKRASTLNQSPMGGFLDVASSAAGGAAGGPVAAIATPIARRMLTPRIASSMASTANGLSQVLKKSPQFFGKYAPALTAAAARGETSLAASAYVLQQRDPEFRQKMQELNNQSPISQSDE